MDFMKQQNQESKNIEEELASFNSETPCLSENTEVINDI